VDTKKKLMVSIKMLKWLCTKKSISGAEIYGNELFSLSPIVKGKIKQKRTKISCNAPFFKKEAHS
jgi:hypothetical protein